MSQTVPAPSAQQDVHASLGKSIDHLGTNRLVDDRVGKDNVDVQDKRTMEQLGTTDASSGKSLDALLADPAELAKLEAMSSSDLARAMGLDTADKSEVPSPEGDGLVHDIDNALANGTATERTLETPAAPAAATPPAAQPVSATPPAQQPAAATPPAPTTDEAYVEGRTGGKIRYEVLQNERSRRAAADAEVVSLRAQLAAKDGTAPAQPAAAATPPPIEQPAQATPARPSVRLYTEAEVTKLRDRFDDERVDQMVQDRTALVMALDEVASLRGEIRENNRSVVQETVQDVIDEHDLLSKWATAAAGTPEALLFAEATATDKMLSHHPGWKDRPWQERVEEAARRTALVNGIQIPGEVPVNTVSAQSLSDKAAAVVKAANGTVTLPATHSDLPAGIPPSQSEREQAAGMSNQQLETMFAGKSEAQIAAYLAQVV